MECTLVIRSRTSLRRWEVDDWTVLAVIASLSAEPETDGELISAIERFGVEHRLKYRGQTLPSLPELPLEQTWCVIDLIGHSVITCGELELPPHDGAFQKDDDDPPGGSDVVWLAVPPDWLMQIAAENWFEKVQTRFTEKMTHKRCDVRAVLFGPPLIEHLIDRVLKIATVQLPNNDEDELRITRTIHAEWLMTSRSDLADRTPREVLLEAREKIDHEYFQRTQQWTAEGHAPPPLQANSNAYRFAAFGTIQVVFYFEMIRALLAECWHCIRTEPTVSRDELCEKIASYQQTWMDTPNEETGQNMTPRRWMEAERRRLPVTTNDDMIDCDCPICQAQADGAFGMGIGFMLFDAHHLELEDEFAFSTVQNRQEWEAGRAMIEESVADFERQRAQREAATGTTDVDASTSAWKSTFVDWDGPAVLNDPMADGAMRIGFCLAEIVDDLKRRPNGRAQLVRLNEAFRDFRRSGSLAGAREAGLQLCKQLEETAGLYPDLVAKSSDLQSRIHEVLRSSEG